MTTQSDPHSFDFRSPGGLPHGVERRLQDWHRGLCSVVCENWAHFSRSSLSMDYEQSITDAMHHVRREIPSPGIGCSCTLGDGGLTTLLVFPRQLILALVNDVLGEMDEPWPEDRELTAVEQSLCEFWFEHFCQAVSESWPRQDALVCRAEGCDAKPQRSRLFAPSEPVILTMFCLLGNFGSEKFFWILPQQPIVELMAETNANVRTRSEASLQQLEARAMEIPAELVVRLGEARLNVADLARLSVGDVIILDQKISDPLAGAIAGETMFRGWPGRVGSRQAFKIDRAY